MRSLLDSCGVYPVPLRGAGDRGAAGADLRDGTRAGGRGARSEGGGGRPESGQPGNRARFVERARRNVEPSAPQIVHFQLRYRRSVRFTMRLNDGEQGSNATKGGARGFR